MNASLSKSEFPRLNAYGDARTRGIAHGESFRERVHNTYDFYMDSLFAGCPLSPAQIADRAETIRTLTLQYAPMMADEIDGIAAGSALEPWKVYVLNARTEILNAQIDECTALYFSATGMLAQNWDWVEPMEALCVIVEHERVDGHRYVSFGEPGMVGKIGMSSAGIGVCLNILFAPHALNGLPVHILIGALLNARDFESAKHLLHHCGLGKASHLLLGSSDGRGLSMEYFGDEYHGLEPEQGMLLHTNHCLGRGAAGRTPDLANSCARYDRLCAHAKSSAHQDLKAVKTLLLSEAGGEDALMRVYREQTILGDHRVGTCATVIMDLPAGHFHIKRGPGCEDRFTTIRVARAT